MNNVESFLTAEQEALVVKAIQDAEKGTSGEIRVHIENSTEKPTLERAKEVFLYLNMEQTKQRNGVLLYVAVNNHQFAIIGDEGINTCVPSDFWKEEKELITKLFSQGKNSEALIKGIANVGEKLKAFFPHESHDENELPDTISKA
jgi:uncharacterized membrane protein